MILVSGAAGFIGSNLCHYLIQNQEDTVLGVDAMLTGSNIHNLDGLRIKDLGFSNFSQKFIFYMLDLRDRGGVNHLFETYPITSVYHLAAESVAADEIIAVHNGHTILHRSFEELWHDLLRWNSVNILSNDPLTETINLADNTQTKCLTYTNGMGEFQKVKQISRHWYKGKMIRVQQKWGSVAVTPNHSLLGHLMQRITPESRENILAVRKLNWYPQKELRCIELSLDQGVRNISKQIDILQYPHSKAVVKRYLTEDVLDSFVSFAGAYIAEGWASFNKANGSYIVGIANCDLTWLQDIVEKAKTFSISKWTIIQDKAGCYQATTSNKTLYMVMRKYFGWGHQGKCIPDWIYFIPRRAQEQFLLSAQQGDGSIVVRKRDILWKYHSTSYRLQCQISLLYTLLGRDFSIFARQKTEQPEQLNQSNIYDIVEVRHYQKQGKNTFISYDYEGWVYDLSIPGTENFAAGLGNIVAHNTHVDRSFTNSASFWESNVLGTANLLKAVLQSGKVARVLNQITDETFGPTFKPVVEGAPFNPQNPYAGSKAAQYYVGRTLYHSYSIPLISTFPTNTYGIRQWPEKLIPKAILSFLKGQPFPLMKTDAIRDWLHVDDHCRALHLLMDRGELGQDYNISPDNRLHNSEVINQLLFLTGNKGRNLIEIVPDRLVHDYQYLVNSQKIYELGWAPQVKFADGLKHTVEWYTNNREQY